MRLKRFGVITVVMAMVLSLAGLASAADAATTVDSTATTIAPGFEEEPFVLYEDPAADPLVGLVNFVIFWGLPEFPEDNPCYVAPVTTAATTTDTTLPTVCLDVSGPNGQVNHGQFVSAFVHWLKSELRNGTLLTAYDGNKGNLVKQAAHDPFGKGAWKKLHATTGSTLDVKTLDADETEVEIEDGDGPNHAYGHNKNK